MASSDMVKFMQVGGSRRAAASRRTASAVATANSNLVSADSLGPGSSDSGPRPIGARRPSRRSDREQPVDLDEWLDTLGAERSLRMLVRYGRLAELFQAATAVGQTRAERYREYDVMAQSSLLSSFLGMLVDDSTQRNTETDRTIWPKKTCAYAAAIEDLFTKLNVEENIWGWTYSLAKYGDWFVRPDVEDKEGIVNVRDDYHPAEVWRIDINGRLMGFAFQENLFTSNATYSYGVGVQPTTVVGPTAFVHFILNYKPAFDKVRVKLPKSAGENDGNDEYRWFRELRDSVDRTAEGKRTALVESDREELTEWLGSEFSYTGVDADSDPEFFYATVTSKYGSSVLHDARRDYKILNLVEQSLALARLSRSPIARVFYVDTSGANVEERDEMVDFIERKFTLTESFDAERDLYKDSYVPLGYMDDIVLPVAGDRGDVRVETIGGDVDIRSIVDLDYFLSKVFSDIHTPKSFMGYDEMLPGFSAEKSLTGLDIRYARSAKKVQRGVLNGMQRLCKIHLDAKLGKDIPLHDIQLEMVAVSSAEEAERVDVISERLDLVSKISDMVGSAGGDKKRALKDMLVSMSSTLSMVKVNDAWFTKPEGSSEADAGVGSGVPELGGPEEEAPAPEEAPEQPAEEVPELPPEEAGV